MKDWDEMKDVYIYVLIYVYIEYILFVEKFIWVFFDVNIKDNFLWFCFF